MTIQVVNNILAAGYFNGPADPSPLPRFWNSRGVDETSFIRIGAGVYTCNLVEPGASLGGSVGFGNALDSLGNPLIVSVRTVPINSADLTEGYMVAIQCQDDAGADVDAVQADFMVLNFMTGSPQNTDQAIIDAGGP